MQTLRLFLDQVNKQFACWGLQPKGMKKFRQNDVTLSYSGYYFQILKILFKTKFKFKILVKLIKLLSSNKGSLAQI